MEKQRKNEKKDAVRSCAPSICLALRSYLIVASNTGTRQSAREWHSGRASRMLVRAQECQTREPLKQMQLLHAFCLIFFQLCIIPISTFCTSTPLGNSMQRSGCCLLRRRSHGTWCIFSLIALRILDGPCTNKAWVWGWNDSGWSRRLLIMSWDLGARMRWHPYIEWWWTQPSAVGSSRRKATVLSLCKMAMEKKKGDENTYVIHPEYKNKFRPGPTKEIIRDVLQSKLDKATYSMETTQLLTKQVADDIKDRLKELTLPRYKIVVQVSIGEQKGQGVRMGTRCFWDGDTDSYASETYSNESLFCVATAYGVYLYWGLGNTSMAWIVALKGRSELTTISWCYVATWL